MATSEARINANRRNALRSTGPKTAEGKARSRANARKHGLTGEGVVLSTEDAARVEGRFDGLMEELAPATILGGVLVKRVAMLSVRLDRSYEQEAANVSAKVLSAETDLADRRLAEAEHLLHKINEGPATNSRRLMATPEGVRAMIAKWVAMKADLDHDAGCRWSWNHATACDHLKGQDGHGVGITPFQAWSQGIFGSFEWLRPDHFAGLSTDEEMRRLSMDKVAELIDAEVAGLADHLTRLDTRAIDAERMLAAKRALFDTSKEAVLARRYEAAAERGIYRAMEELRQVEAEAEDRIAPAVATPGPSPQAEEQPKVEEPPPAPEPGVGSFGSEVPEAKVEDARPASDRASRPPEVRPGAEIGASAA